MSFLAWLPQLANLAISRNVGARQSELAYRAQGESLGQDAGELERQAGEREKESDGLGMQLKDASLQAIRPGAVNARPERYRRYLRGRR